MKKYTESHEWVVAEEGIATIGVTEHAQSELGDIVYVELPETDKEVSAGEDAAVLESTKAAADVYTPLSGTITEVNSALSDKPELINESPETNGWLFKLKMANQDELDALMDEDQYKGSLT